MSNKIQKYLIHFEPGVRDSLEQYADGRPLSKVINRALVFFIEQYAKKNKTESFPF